MAGNRAHSLWKKDEWDAIVSTAHMAGVKVAVHVNTTEAAVAAINAGVDDMNSDYYPGQYPKYPAGDPQS